MSFSAQALVEKAGAALVAVVVGFAQPLSGFVLNPVQSPKAPWAIRGCMAALPATILVLASVAPREPRNGSR